MPFRHSFVLCAVLLALAAPVRAQVNITTWQNSLQHTGNNASETILTPANVSASGGFGLLFSQALDGQTYGQPLLVSGVTVAGAQHNVVYVGTQHCSLFAYDADSNTGSNASALWQDSLLPAGTVPVPQSVVSSSDIPVELGCTTTPVIDPGSSTIYTVSKVQRTADTTYHQYLYALDLATGATKFGSPVEISVNFPGTASADPAVNGMLPFNPLREHLRSAMTLYNGVVYLAYASHSDKTPYHGEIIGFDATTLQIVKTFITTPNGGTPEGGIWQSGAGLAFDADGNLYVEVGNGKWAQDHPSYGTDWGQSILKMSTSGALTMSYDNSLTWFTPNNWDTLNNGDLDIGAGGPLILPDQSGPHQHVMLCGSKGGVFYVIDRDNLGGMGMPNNSVQEIAESKACFVTPSYFNGCVYYSLAGGPLEQRAVGYSAVDGSYISTSPTTSTNVYNIKGSGCFISSNGTTNGVVWVLNGAGIDAYNATSVAGAPIYTASAVLPGNITCTTTKFSLPIVANGKVYYTAYSGTNTGHLLVSGLLTTGTTVPAAPSNAVATANSSSTVTLTWKDNSNNEAGFKIERSASATTGFVEIGEVGAGVTTYPDTGLASQTVYYYQIVATNSVGDSDPSNVVGVTTYPAYSEQGLVAFWRMDETSGSTLKDETDKGHTGTINGEAGLGAGFINNGVTLHGTGQSPSNVTVANKKDMQFALGASFTLAAWVNPSTFRGTEQTVIAKSSDQGNEYGIWINANNQWVFRGPGGDVVGPTVTDGAWTHVAVAQAGNSKVRQIFINGKLAATGPAQAADGAGDLWMGQQNVSGNAESLPGTIDEVRLYSRALHPSEITNLMGPPVLEAVSRQVEGSAGTFGLLLWPYNVSKNEPREGATVGQYKLAAFFSAPVTGVTASLKRLDGSTPVGQTGTVTYDATGKSAIIPVTGVGNEQALLLHLSGIQPGNGTMDLPFNVLWGDVNSDGVVNSTDASVVAANHVAVVNGKTAVDDIDCNGTVDSNDDALVNAAIGTSLDGQ